MGTTNKMERFFATLPPIMIVVGVISFIVAIGGNVYHMLGNLALGQLGPSAGNAVGLLLSVVADSLVNPLLLIGMAALVHRANSFGAGS